MLGSARKFLCSARSSSKNLRSYPTLSKTLQVKSKQIIYHHQGFHRYRRRDQLHRQDHLRHYPHHRLHHLLEVESIQNDNMNDFVFTL